VCDAFAPSRYPPPVTVNPEHVGYVVQRYLPDSPMGEVVPGYHRLPEAEAMCARLNSDPALAATLRPRRTYL
jgi:hypothetical protein